MKKLYFFLTLFGCFTFIQSQADTVTITQSGNSFAPLTLQVNVGDVIHFVWTGGTHNTTSAVVPEGAESWAAPLTMSSPTFDYTVEVPGIYAYTCTFHIGMGGGFQASAPSNIAPVIAAAPEFTAGIEGFSKTLFVNIENHHAALTTIRLIDITGREVEVLLNAQVGLGEQIFRYDLSARQRGMYFVRLEQAGRVVTRKVMLN
jgi:plastocyanin